MVSKFSLIIKVGTIIIPAFFYAIITGRLTIKQLNSVILFSGSGAPWKNK